MPPTRRTTRTTPATTTTPTTTVTDAQLQALIDQGVAAALAERDASRSRDGDNSHGSGTWRKKASAILNGIALTLTFPLEVPAYEFSKALKNVKYASYTLQGIALMWWNSHVRAVGQDVAYTMPWTA
ncbi:hypothetical protein Tco_0729057 [Tanacetum coccineum]|uniref:Uncharacterized protein n=1 Tax=Tanacetum coccineum TaxID=301880 RepID=A0ABQ4YNY6_9ASTR